MSSMNFSSSKQNIKPPQRGIFPLDHESECKPYMTVSFVCLVCCLLSSTHNIIIYSNNISTHAHILLLHNMYTIQIEIYIMSKGTKG